MAVVLRDSPEYKISEGTIRGNFVVGSDLSLLTPTWIYHFKWVYYLLFGLAAGSFINVVIYRLPLGKSLFRPPSSCPACGTRIPWYDNIPIVSFILLGARCRFCKAPISWRYPLVEFLAVLIFLTVYFARPDMNDLQRGFQIVFLLLLLAIAFIDGEYQIIPDQLTYPGILIGIIGNSVLFFPHNRQFLESLTGGIGFGFLIWLIRVFGGFVFRREAMGIGDIKLAAMMGAFLGWRLSLVAFVVAVFSALAIAPVVSFISRWSRRRRLVLLVSPNSLREPQVGAALTQFVSSQTASPEIATGVLTGDSLPEYSLVTADDFETFVHQHSAVSPISISGSHLSLALTNAPAGTVFTPLLLILSEAVALSQQERFIVCQRLLENRLQLAVIALGEAASSESLRALSNESGGLFLPVSDFSLLSEALGQVAHHWSFTEVPFGTFLAAGGAASLFFGDYLSYLYLSLFWRG